jgi:hypothetical protein
MKGTKAEWTVVCGGDESPSLPYRFCKELGINPKENTRGYEYIWEFIHDKIHEMNSQEISSPFCSTIFRVVGAELQKKQIFHSDVTESLSFVKKATLGNIQKGEIAPSDIHGFGLFAKEEVVKGEILCTLDGQRMDYGEYTRLHELFRQNGLVPYTDKYFFMEWNMIEENIVLARPYRTMYSYINHSEKANCLVVPHVDYRAVDLIATKDINKGDEFLLDYSLEPLPDSYLSNQEKSFLQ